jgi:predicted membrane channel-forming protein YqfA (hemolysin III family)
LFIAVGYFFITGSKGDIGAIYRRRTDERQRNVSMKASRLAMIVMFALCFVIALIEVASNSNYWQEDAIGSVGGVSFFVGLVIYGVRDEDTAGTSRGIMSSDTVDDASDVDEVRPPM